MTARRPDSAPRTEAPDTAPAEDGGAIGPVPGGGYPIPEAPTNPGPTRERWIWTGLVAGIGLLVFGTLVASWLSAPRAPIQQLTVADVLHGPEDPADRFGSHEIQIIGWYAAITSGCRGDSGGADASIAWLQAICPVRVLVPQPPAEGVGQETLLQSAVRLAAPNGEPFPPPATLGGGTASLEQLVFTGHFDDAAAQRCVGERTSLCRNAFVVSGYTGLLR